MTNLSRSLMVGALLAAGASPLCAQVNSNDTPLNNNGDVVFIYSSPSSGFTSLAFPPDVTGDLYWRAHSGSNMMCDVDAVIGSAMEVDGYYESLFDTDWSTTPSFYSRSHGPALPDSAGLGGLEPSFFQLGLTTETVVLVGPSGFGNPCTVAPSLCSPSGGTCPPPGFVNGYLIDLAFGSTPGTGIVLAADGTSASDTATTWFVTGGMTASGGTCGLGDYDLQDVHSTDETQADPTGNGVNPSGGFQTAASGPVQEGIASMAEANETWRGNVVNVVADTGTGSSVEVGDNGGGAMNGRNLSVGSGIATIGVELRDLAGSAIPNLGIVGASLTKLPNPGLPALGGNLLVLPDGLFNSTSGVWQGAVTATSFVFTAEGAFTGAQLSVPTTAGSTTGTVLHIQGATFNLASFTVDSTNAWCATLYP